MTDDTDKNGQVHSAQANPQGSPQVAGDSISVGVGEAAKNVAAGKNIIQIGSLSVPKWLALFIVAVLALVAVLVGVVAYFSRQAGESTERAAAILAYTPTPAPTATPIPTATPTALPFAPAADGETMIVILPFHSTAANDSEPHKKIWRRIQDLLKQMPNKSVTAVIDPNAVFTADQQAEAELIGKRYNASMVIWGEDTGVELIASFLNLREPDFAAADVDIQETQRTAVAADPEPYKKFVLQELPGELAFLSLFALGQTDFTNGEYLSAMNMIESAIAQVDSPKIAAIGEQGAGVLQGLADAYFLLGWLNQENLDLAAAVVDYNQAITLDPQNALAYINLGLAYYDKRDLDKAITDYNRAITIDPQNALAYSNLGLAYSDNGDLGKAFAAYKQAISLDSNFAPAYINQGRAYHATHDLNKAIADYNRAIALDPHNALAYVNRGITYRAMGDLDKAIADYNRAITLDPQYALGYYNRGNAYIDKHELEKAIADYNRAITLDPRYDLAYYNRGHAYHDKGDLDKAIADYSRAITLDPQNAIAYNNLGNAYSDKGDLDKAIVAYNQAITLNPKFAFAYNNRGLTYSDKGELDKAIADYNQAVTIDPLYGLAYHNRGNAYGDRGDLDSAIADYTKAIEIDPQDANSYNLLCWSLALQQKSQQAMTYCEKAVVLAENPFFADSRGLAHALLGDFPAAVADFQVYVDWLAEKSPDETELIEQRESWIESLKRGENPFTPEVLEGLKNSSDSRVPNRDMFN